MATSFQSIYKKFLSLIDDYELALIEEEELNEVLYGYLDMARSLDFPQCEKDLTASTEINGVGEFVETLTTQEEHILALCMKKAWLSSKLNSADLMVKDIGDRDYKAVQGTGYIKELSKLDEKIENEIYKYTNIYTWRNFSLEGW